MSDEECCDSGCKPCVLDPEDGEVIDLLDYIGGEFQPASCEHWINDLSPATGLRIARIPCSDHRDIDAAVEAARNALPEWSALAHTERADWLDKIADALEARSEEVAQLESLDAGKPITLARTVDAARSVANFRFFAEQVREFTAETFEMKDATNHVVYKPVGVAGLITPWNLPLYLLSWKVAPALAMGNTVVAKPSELTPMTASLLAEVVDEVGLPAGVFNLVHGSGEHAGAPLTSHPGVDLISFTGGTETGAKVAESASSTFKKLSLELGGKNATIVCADADFGKTIPGVVRAGFLNQGQVCLCGSRILIEESIYDQFVDALLAEVQSLQIGDLSDPETTLGALISKEHLEKVAGYIELSQKEGGTILTGGSPPEGLPEEFANGNWLSPTVIDGLPPDSRTATEEIFGPVVTLHPFADEAEALAIANNTDYGLAGSVWTADLAKGRRIAEGIDTGMVWVNTWLHRDLRVPFGGVKESGVGREGGRWSLQFYSHATNICIKLD
uniref:Aldehyde dehydrogenase (DmpC) n=1 Tax=uncultured marine group II/III euryarchaeote KM3_192_D09 TaxID=1457965 RepID=A0A075GRV3_9EURY|nr:aldehyde dehydrogenase (dmpC) [uncultured marine group II/III euryarchaeote KM3_192_D09]